MNSQNILLGVSGGIAAYKAPELVRRLTERGATVQVVATQSALEFVTATTLQAVSGRPVRSSLWDPAAEAAMGHIELARWADQVLIAPATAEFMSRLAAGGAADLLSTLCLASEAPLTIAPAMNRVMWAHPAVQANREILERRGVRIVGPDAGDQACGEQGLGRMSEPDAIAALMFAGEALPGRQGPVRPAAISKSRPLAGKTVLITAGPTHEAIDPVRYITNRSSGKMGYALAEAALLAGARVILVSGPVNLATPAGAERVDVESAEDLYKATHAHIKGTDIFIAAAAVADYQLQQVAKHKIKKSQVEISLELTRAPDTLASVAKLSPGPFTVGFAAETTRLRDYARGKLQNKNLDMIVANQVGPDEGFDKDDNAVEVFWPTGEKSFPKALKTELARDLIALIAERYQERLNASTQPDLPALSSRP
ncbi:MAG: bifunctional phosphopantothenoylcysteine decarboxylase/phosphopantothenate--cysteine ligase CoaBC [Woeseia sp.]|nr:bifunctional phosphopantothenoylcysteine decarboxylase/phosphopantothenate--cysteine ligase CoaBC [Woeseia sp.]